MTGAGHDELTMLVAEDAGRRAVAISSPNPPVGCVILDAAGRPAGTGSTGRPGEPHAEVAALAAAGERARGGSAYVTLEPCGHHGRTRPCTAALIAAGITRVIHAVDDPVPGHGGAAQLRQAGIEIRSGAGFDQVSTGSLRAWLHRTATGRPWVTMKLATTLDGRVAATDGTSRWITGPEARADVHRLRRTADAVLVGTGTVLADNPRLTVHDSDGQPVGDHQPLRVVAGHRDLPAAAHVFDTDAPTRVMRNHNPHAVLQELAEHGALHVLIEAGPTLSTDYLRAGAVDQVVLYLAPKLLGSGPAAIEELGVPSIAGAWQLRLRDCTPLGPDLRLTADL